MLVTNLSCAFSSAGHMSTILALSDADILGNPVDTEKQLMQRVIDAGGHARSANIRNRHNIFAGAAKLKREISEIAPDIIHVHTARALLMLALVRPDCPIILTHHNSILSFPAILFRLFDRLVSGYVGISRECTNMVETHAGKPVTLIRNAAGTGFDTGQLRRLQGDKFQILLVGAVSEQKNYPAIVKAAPILKDRLAQSGKSARILVAGPGSADAIGGLRSLAKSLRVTDMVEFLGSRNDIRDLIRSSDLFVNCSLYEGLPVAIIEAMSGGLPIIAANVSGNRELVDADANGMLVAAQNPVRLADAIADILTSPQKYAAMSRASIRKSRQFSIESCASSHLALYSGLLPAKSGKGSSLRAKRGNISPATGPALPPKT